MTKEDLLVAYSDEARSYDLHFSNVRTTLGTFFLTVAFGSASYLYDKYRDTIAASIEQQNQLLYVPLGFLVIAFLLSGMFHRLTRACHAYQHDLENAVAWDGANPEVKPPTNLRTYLKRKLAINGTFVETREWLTTKGWKWGWVAIPLTVLWWLLRWLKGLIFDAPQVLLLGLMVVYWIGFHHMQDTRWTKEVMQTKPLVVSLKILPKNKKPPGMRVAWSRLDNDATIVYRATVADQYGVTVCQTALISASEFECGELRRAGVGQPLPEAALQSLRVNIEAFDLGLVAQSLKYVKDDS